MSKFFKCRVKATITKDLQVEVRDDQGEDEAAEIAAQCFNLNKDGIPERYNEEVTHVNTMTQEEIDSDQPIFDNESEIV